MNKPYIIILIIGIFLLVIGASGDEWNRPLTIISQINNISNNISNNMITNNNYTMNNNYTTINNYTTNYTTNNNYTMNNNYTTINNYTTNNNYTYNLTPVFGELYFINDTPMQVGLKQIDVFVPIVNLTNGSYSNVALNGSMMTILVNGTYYISFSSSIAGLVATKTYDISLFNNDVVIRKCGSRVRETALLQELSLSWSCITNLTVQDNISIRGNTNTSTLSNFTTRRINWNIRKI